MNLDFLPEDIRNEVLKEVPELDNSTVTYDSNIVDINSEPDLSINTVVESEPRVIEDIEVEVFNVEPIESNIESDIEEVVLESINRQDNAEYYNSDIIDDIPVPAINELMESIEEYESVLEEEEVFDDTQSNINDEPIVNSNSEFQVEDEIASNLMRFKDATWFDIIQQQEVVLAGLGGIGSYVNYFLARLRPKHIYIFDADSFEPHNMAGQLVSTNYISVNKACVAGDIGEKFSKYYNYNIYPDKYTKSSLVLPIMICGFDNMEARKTFFNNWKSQCYENGEYCYEKAKNCLLIDGRLLAEEFQIICIHGCDEWSIKDYESRFLFSDADVADVACSLKQTSHIAGMIATHMVSNFVNFCNNMNPNNPERRIPYFMAFNGLLNSYVHEYL